MVMASKTGAVLVGLLGMAATLQVAASGDASSTLQTFDFEATVQADGSVTDIQPDSALPESIQALVRKRVATWRYAPARWQGQAAPSKIAQRIKAEAVPLREGGAALRIVEVTEQPRFEPGTLRMQPPRFPPGLARAGVNAALVYSVLFDERGIPKNVELVYPIVRNSTIVQLDEASREALRRWIVQKTFNGAPIACRVKVPLTFVTTVDDASLRAPPEVDALFEAYADRCPQAELETRVVGTLL